jgi:site-specific recombinase XerD
MKKKITRMADEVLASLVKGTTSPRDSALILILAESGLKLSEIAELSRSSITSQRDAYPDGAGQVFGRGQTLVPRWSGRARDFLIGPLAMAALDAYLTTVPCDDNQAPMFLSTDGRRLDSRAVGNIVRKLIRRLGLAPFPARGFRHSLALRFVHAGLGVDVLKKLLGYSDTSCFENHVLLTLDILVCDYLRAIGSFPWYQTP